MDILLWSLMAIFGLGILFIRRFDMSSVLGYVLLVVCIVTFALFEFMQLRNYLDPGWDGAFVALSVLLLVWLSFKITKPIKHRKLKQGVAPVGNENEEASGKKQESMADTKVSETGDKKD